MMSLAKVRGASMRLALKIVAVCLIGMGTIWILQGVNILPGSFMTGQKVWAYRGAAIALAGLVVLLLTRQKHKSA
jgi:hypothetical protein